MALKCVEDLKSVVDKLPVKDQQFARSLLASVAKYRFPTEKQEHWIKTLYDRAVNPPAPPTGESVGDLTKLVNLFVGVRGKLKFPAIRFQTPEGTAFKITPAGPNSTNAGHLYVKRSDSTYLGKISPDGQFFEARGVAAEGVAEAIKAFASNPTTAASSYGHLTGSCCFCGLTLTDGRSVEVGYGPICAEKYNLPWGER
jgi:hypothetical protein